MKIDLSQFRQTFLQESADHVASMEIGLLELRSTPDDIELLNGIFRAAHSIKGGAGSFGLTNLVRFTHSLENLLDRLRELEMRATDEVIDVMLRSVDVLRGLLDADAGAEMPAEAVELNACIVALMSGEASKPEAGTQDSLAQESTVQAEAGPGTKRYKVEFTPDREMFSSGTTRLRCCAILPHWVPVSLCELHTENLPALADLDPSQCYLSWTVELASTCEEAELREVFEFVEHLAEVRIDLEQASQQPGNALVLESAASQ